MSNGLPPLNEDTEATYHYLNNLLRGFEENVTFAESGLDSQCWVWQKKDRVWYNGKSSSIRGLAYDHAYPDTRFSRAEINNICGTDLCINPDHLTSPGWDFMIELEHLTSGGVGASRIHEALQLTEVEVDSRIRALDKSSLTAGQARAIYAYHTSLLAERRVDAEDIEDADLRRSAVAGQQEAFTRIENTLVRRLKIAA